MLSEEDGRMLLSLARQTIEKFASSETPVKPEKYPNMLDSKRGIFCTIMKRHGKKYELRGCIGMPYPVTPLIKGVMAAAYSAAFEDPRFPKLEKSELKDIKVELSVLTEPKLIQAKGDNILNEIKIGEDGLIIEYGPYSGLLLPQVATEQKWDVKKFLENLCIKAGLTPGMWLSAKLYKFQAQIFRE